MGAFTATTTPQAVTTVYPPAQSYKSISPITPDRREVQRGFFIQNLGAQRVAIGADSSLTFATGLVLAANDRIYFNEPVPSGYLFWVKAETGTCDVRHQML